MKFRHFSLLVASLLLTGCTNVQYLDRPAPPGNPVPPPIATAPTVAQEIARTPSGQILRQESNQQDYRTISDQLREPEATAPVAYTQAPGYSFQKAYVAQGSPRIAIFLNRNLSGEVRQWSTQNKLTTAGSGKISASGASFSQAEAGAVKGEGNQTVYAQQYMDEQSQNFLPREDLWLIENGFIQPFMDTNTKLVDRSTIMRLAAATDPETRNSDYLISPKLIEMKSLAQYADIFIELLVTREPAQPTGFFMKASAKEIKSGRILATVTTLTWDWDALQAQSEQAVATASGYEFQTNKISIPLDYASGLLAGQLMTELQNRWK